jgi:hypothetical protein
MWGLLGEVTATILVERDGAESPGHEAADGEALPVDASALPVPVPPGARGRAGDHPRPGPVDAPRDGRLARPRRVGRP